MIRLYENPGWGSAIVELQLLFYGMPHELVAASYPSFAHTEVPERFVPEAERAFALPMLTRAMQRNFG